MALFSSRLMLLCINVHYCCRSYDLLSRCIGYLFTCTVWEHLQRQLSRVTVSIHGLIKSYKSLRYTVRETVTGLPAVLSQQVRSQCTISHCALHTVHRVGDRRWITCCSVSAAVFTLRHLTLRTAHCAQGTQLYTYAFITLHTLMSTTP